MKSRFAFLLAALCTACSSTDETIPPPGDASSSQCTFTGGPEADIPDPKPHTPRWAFRPWISKDISNGPDTYDFVKGFEDRDIPVGVVVLDSPWETNYNTFVPNPKRYPEFPKLVSDLHAKKIRLVLWVTQMVNDLSFDVEPGGDKYDGEASNYIEGYDCKFFVNDGQSYGWWKGKGAGVDFFDARARAWWHAQQKPLLDMGVDGWKLDFGESYIDGDTVKTSAGTVTHQQYSERYYQDFLQYGVRVRGPEDFVTMVRPWDASYHHEPRFFARREHAPVAWVGDNRRDWVGLIDALDHIFVSAQAGYPVVGSDIGGYLDLDDKDIASMVKIPPDTLVFARWTAMSAFMPFFQLHGRANLAPWTVTDHVDETVAAYRYHAKLHDALVPFFYSLSEEAWSKGGSILHPIGDKAAWANDWRFMVGDALLVAPLIEASGKRDVQLPAGEWYDWWTPGAAAQTGKVTVDYASDRTRLPVFVKRGAIIPLDVVDDANAFGTAASKGTHTILVWPAATATSFTLHEEDAKPTTITAAAGTVKVSRATRVLNVRIHAETKPASVELDGTALGDSGTRVALDGAASGFAYDAATKELWVKAPAGGEHSIGWK